LPLSLFIPACSRIFSVKNTLWRLCIGLFAGHELDAVAQREWRLLYGLRDLDPMLGQHLFIALHVPLCAGLVQLCGHRRRRVRELARQWLAALALVHAGLHQRLRDDPLYLFDSLLSQSLIFGCGAAGLLYLLLGLATRNRRAVHPAHP
jgi:hypothetical protein